MRAQQIISSEMVSYKRSPYKPYCVLGQGLLNLVVLDLTNVLEENESNHHGLSNYYII